MSVCFKKTTGKFEFSLSVKLDIGHGLYFRVVMLLMDIIALVLLEDLFFRPRILVCL